MFNAMDFVKRELQTSVDTHVKMMEDRTLMDTVGRITEACIKAYQAGNKTLLAGNGGSAADAQHIAGEFVSRFYFDRPGLPSIALSTDTSILTAIGNDYGYENLFSRQVQAQGKPGDIFFGITTSGKSPNILKAFDQARSMGLRTVAMTSSKATELAKMVDFAILVPSTVTPKIQECHIMIGHAICAGVEEALFKK